MIISILQWIVKNLSVLIALAALIVSILSVIQSRKHQKQYILHSTPRPLIQVNGHIIDEDNKRLLVRLENNGEGIALNIILNVSFSKQPLIGLRGNQLEPGKNHTWVLPDTIMVPSEFQFTIQFTTESGLKITEVIDTYTLGERRQIYNITNLKSSR